MIHARFVFKKSSLSSLEVAGHANSAPKGEDLVCAGVSAIVLGGLNALDDEHEIKIEEGHVLLRAIKAPSKHDAVVLETIYRQLKSLAESHPQYVRLERKDEQ